MLETAAITKRETAEYVGDCCHHKNRETAEREKSHNQAVYLREVYTTEMIRTFSIQLSVKKEKTRLKTHQQNADPCVNTWHL